MELREFVRDSLIAILDGVKQAQDEIHLQKVGAAVNPRFEDSGSLQEEDVQTMEFDIAVSVNEKSEGGGGGSVKVVGIFDAGGRISQSVESGSVSRIKFSLKVLPPFTTVARHLTPREALPTSRG